MSAQMVPAEVVLEQLGERVVVLVVVAPERQEVPAGSNGKRAFACDVGGAAGAAGECRTGQTFCHIQVLRSASATASCESFTDTSRTADCSVNPTCDCLCTNDLFFHCHTECACTETDGQVTVTCSQI